MARPGVTKRSRESSHQLTDKTTARTTSIYSDKRIRNLINIESFSRNENLNVQKNWLKKTNPVRTTDCR